MHSPYIQTGLEELHGSRSYVCLKRVESMLKVFKSLGIELVFFEDGPAQEVKYDTIIQRANDNYAIVMEIIDAVNRGIPTENIVQNARKIVITRLHNQSIRNLCKMYGQVIKTYHNECDTEIANYANEHNALAIMADDTDFLIYPGKIK